MGSLKISPEVPNESKVFLLTTFNSLNIGLGILLFIVLVAILAPFLNLHDPLKMNISLRFAPLGTDNHLLGTDNLGRDLLSRFIWGARPSIIIGLVLQILIMQIAIF